MFPRKPSVYKVGYTNFPPLMTNAAGVPGGFAVDVVKEAARRTGIRIEWVLVRSGPEALLKSGAIDLYPLMANLPERKHRVHISQAWWESPLALVVDRKANFKSPEEVDGRPIAVVGFSVAEQISRQVFPNSTPIRKMPYDEVLRAVCTGEAEASFLTLSLYLELLQQGVRGCEGKSLAPLLPDASISYGIGARKGAEGVADAIASEIVTLTYDGTIAKLGAKSGEIVSNQAQLIRGLSKARRNRNLLLLIAAVLAIVTGISFWQNRRVRHARESAERARKAEAEFLAHVSHEIRTPMNGVLGMLGLALETNSNPEMHDYLETANHSAVALMSVLNDILDFSKIDAGRLDLEHIDFSPAGVIEQCVKTLSTEARRKGLSLDTDIAPDVPRLCVGDPNRLRQILLNLLGNAIKFTERGGVTVKLGVGRTGDSDVALNFEVRDTGIGIPLSKQESIFKAFAQADRSTTRKFGGTGLGLAIATRLVEMMNGRIWVQSEPDRGSTFSFFIVLGRSFTPALNAARTSA